MLDRTTEGSHSHRMESQTLFKKYGGYDSVFKIVSLFYEKILADEFVSGFFDDVDMEGLIRHQTNFVGMVLGGPANQYTGRDLKTAHQSLTISHAHFSRVAEHLHASLVECGVEPSDINTIMTVVASRASDVVS